MNQLDMVGFWKTGSGAIYKFQSECDYLVALYWQPSEGQVAVGYKQGDLAFKGDLVGKILAGQFYHRFSLKEKDRCPGIWELRTTIYIQVADSGDSMTGQLLLSHLPDQGCKPDDRMLQELVFERVAPETLNDVKPESSHRAIGKKFSSGI
jgi:hypothetical protein